MSLTRRALFATPLLAAAGPPPLAARPIDRLSTPWWRERHAAKRALIAQRRDFPLLLLGDSITQNLESTGREPWRDYRAAAAAFPAHLNLGFKGDATCHLLWRMRNGELEGLAPRHAVILIGANNMGRVHWPVADNLEGIDAVVHEARLRLPAARIILLGVLPSDRSAWVTESTAALNRALAARYAQSDIVWHDATALFLAAGTLDHSLFYDPLLRPPEPALHPTPQGMIRLAHALAPLLAR